LVAVEAVAAAGQAKMRKVQRRVRPLMPPCCVIALSLEKICLAKYIGTDDGMGFSEEI